MRKRCFQIAASLLFSIFVLSSSGNGNTFIENHKQPFSFENNFAQRDFNHSQKIFRLTQESYFTYRSDSAQEEEMADVYGFKGKSLKRAFLYSLIIPGSGEFYAGSKIKAAIFFGLDVTLWALYSNYHGKGKDKEDEYQTFADQSWSKDEYFQWLADSLYKVPYVDSDTGAYWDQEKQEWTYLSHHLPDTKTQQYYEMIGKYEQFRWGWVDYDDYTKFSITRDVYLGMRRDSNDLLNKAKYSAMISLANHILSAFDAAISVKKYNKKGERFSQLQFQMRLVEKDREIIPLFTASMRF